MEKIFYMMLFAGVLALMFFRGSARAGEKETKAWELIEQGALLIDVRTDTEYYSGHLDGAINISHERTSEITKAIGLDKSRPVVLYCRSGRRSGLTQSALERRGYTHVYNAGSYQALNINRPHAADDQSPKP